MRLESLQNAEATGDREMSEVLFSGAILIVIAVLVHLFGLEKYL